MMPKKDKAARLAHEIGTTAARHARELALAQVQDIPSHCADCDCDGCHDRCLCGLAEALEMISIP
ncbi:MAG: hypothetical protein VW712_07725 [Paracoccaceae bacterium]